MRPIAARCSARARRRGRLPARKAVRSTISTEEDDMGVAAQRKDHGRFTSSRPDLAELKARLARIRPEIEARAPATERACRVGEENMAALRAIGYFDIVKPA